MEQANGLGRTGKTGTVCVLFVCRVGRLTLCAASKDKHSVTQPAQSNPGRCPWEEEADWLWLSLCEVLLL